MSIDRPTDSRELSAEEISGIIDGEKRRLVENGEINIQETRPFSPPEITDYSAFGSPESKMAAETFVDSIRAWLKIPCIIDSFPSTPEGDAARLAWKYSYWNNLEKQYGAEVGKRFYSKVLEENKLRENVLAYPRLELGTLINYLNRSSQEVHTRLASEIKTELSMIQFPVEYKTLSIDEKLAFVEKYEDGMLRILQNLASFANN